jgi:hypothetical protein
MDVNVTCDRNINHGSGVSARQDAGHTQCGGVDSRADPPDIDFTGPPRSRNSRHRNTFGVEDRARDTDDPGGGLLVLVGDTVDCGTTKLLPQDVSITNCSRPDSHQSGSDSSLYYRGV